MISRQLQIVYQVFGKKQREDGCARVKMTIIISNLTSAIEDTTPLLIFNLYPVNLIITILRNTDDDLRERVETFVFVIIVTTAVKLPTL